MKFEDIQREWAEDSKINKARLDDESLRQPELHNKYYKMYLMCRKELNSLIHSKKKFEHLKWEYYSGKLDQETMSELGWKPFPKELKTETMLQKYIDSDTDIIKLNLRIANQTDYCDFIKTIIKEINNRSFQIKNAIEFLRFSSGLN